MLAYGLWYWLEYRSLHSRIDALHAMGELVEPDDFNRGAPLETNGAKDVSAAAAIFNENDEEYSAIDHAPTTRPTPPESWPYLEASVRWYQPALQRLDRAVIKPSCKWDHRFVSPVMWNLSLHELSECDSLSLLLISSAMVELHHAHDSTAFRYLGDTLYLSAAEEWVPSDIGHVRAALMVDAFLRRLEQFLTAFRIDNTATDAVRPAEVRSLIKVLIDESGTNAGLRFGLAADRMSLCDMWISVFGAESLYSYLGRPCALHLARQKLDEQTSFDTALVTSSNLPVARQKLAQLTAASDDIDHKSVAAGFEKVAKFHFIAITDRRIAAIALAIKLYRFDHAGVYPARLDALVPEYLSAVPSDPMASTPSPLRYIATGNDPVIYSVGDNDKDDGGSDAAEPGQYGELDEWQRLDRVFHLTDKVRPYICVPRPPTGQGGWLGPTYPSPVAPWEKQPTTSPR